MDNTNFYHDIDIYGREQRPGNALEYYNADAVKNALIFFLTSGKGDYIRNPSAGGLVDWSTFKQMSDLNIQKMSFLLKNAISNNFVPAIELQSINLTPDYENRILQIDITYIDKTSLTINQVSLFTDTSYSYQKFEYIDVAYIEENLMKFIMLQKTDDPSRRLIFNSDDGLWYYGKFKLNNFTTSDIFFDQILAIANT
jgi:hypothetical protein